LRKSIALLLIVIFLASLIVLPCATVVAEPKTIVVPDDYATIDEALINAVQGDTIFVKQGVYHETLKIEKPVSIVGEDRDTTVIVGVLRDGVKVPITIRQNNVSVTGFTLSDGYAGIQLSGNFCSVTGNKIRNTNFGIIISFCSQNNISGNIVDSVKYSAIKLAIASANLIQKNQVSSSDIGIEVSQSSHNNTISENNVQSTAHQGISLSHSDDNMIIGNSVSDCGMGTSIYVANNNTFRRNSFLGNPEQASADEWYAKTFGYGGSINIYTENFWSDYQSKYPNAKEVDSSGIGNIPYVINENNTDYRPLIRQGDLSAITSAPTPIPTTESTPEIQLQIVAIVIIVLGISGLLVYFKKLYGRQGPTVRISAPFLVTRMVSSIRTPPKLGT